MTSLRHLTHWSPLWQRSRGCPVCAKRLAPKQTVEVLRLQPGDVIAVRCEQPLSRDAIAQIKGQMTDLFPGHKTIVFDAGLSLMVAREDELFHESDIVPALERLMKARH